jgi:hypothetical protein
MNPGRRISTSLLSRLSSDPLSGTNSFQNQIEQLTSGFIEQATDVKTLTAMVSGGLAYRLGKSGVIALGVGRISALPLRVMAVGMGLSTEVTAFEFTNRTLTSLSLEGEGRGEGGPSSLWKWNGPAGWKQGLLSSAATFGLLKGAGSLAQGQNILVQHLFQDAAMVAGHQVLAALKVAPKPEGTIAEQLVHTEATNLQMEAGRELVHGLFPGIASRERGLNSILPFLENRIANRFQEFFWPLVPIFGSEVVGTRGNKGEIRTRADLGENPFVLKMERTGEKGGAKTQHRKLMEIVEEVKTNPLLASELSDSALKGNKWAMEAIKYLPIRILASLAKTDLHALYALRDLALAGKKSAKRAMKTLKTNGLAQLAKTNLKAVLALSLLWEETGNKGAGEALRNLDPKTVFHILDTVPGGETAFLRIARSGNEGASKMLKD